MGGDFEHGKALPATEPGPWSANLYLNGTKLGFCLCKLLNRFDKIGLQPILIGFQAPPEILPRSNYAQ
jgi:hypothetical protein